MEENLARNETYLGLKKKKNQKLNRIAKYYVDQRRLLFKI